MFKIQDSLSSSLFISYFLSLFFSFSLSFFLSFVLLSFIFLFVTFFRKPVFMFYTHKKALEASFGSSRLLGAPSDSFGILENFLLRLSCTYSN